MLHAQLVQHASQLDTYLPAWRRWAVTPFQQPEWQLAWWEQFRTSKQSLCVVTVSNNGGDLVGLAPFYLVANRWLGNSIRFLGDGRACTDFQSILSIQDREREVAECVARYVLAKQSTLHWQALDLEGVAAGDMAMQAFAKQFDDLDCHLHVSSKLSTWRVDLTGGWEGVLSRLSKNQRSQSRNFINRFDKDPSLEFEIANEPESVAAALFCCMELHSKRWQSSGQVGCFDDERFRSFVQRASEYLSVSRQVELMYVKKDGVPISSLLLYSDSFGNGFVYQCGRDPTVNKMRIGNILNLIVVREFCRRGVAFLDYMRGDEHYKFRLGASPQACNRVRVIPPKVLAQVQDAISVNAKSALSVLNSNVLHWNTGHSKSS